MVDFSWNSIIGYANSDSLEAEINKDLKWATLRNKILERDEHECVKCGIIKNLVIHVNTKWNRVFEKNLITLCYWCDLEVHGEKLFDSSKIGFWELDGDQTVSTLSKKEKSTNYVQDDNVKYGKKSWTYDFDKSDNEDEEWEDLRDLILKRDRYRCIDCGFSKNLTVDHIVPRHAGGSNEHDNLQTLCVRCHEKKHGRKIFGEDQVFSKQQKKYKPNSKVVNIVSAIGSNGSLSIEYTDEKGKITHREIKPIRIFEEHGILYVRSYCMLRNAERTFRLSRMTIN